MSRSLAATFLQRALYKQAGRPFTRRQFIKSGALAAAGLAIPWSCKSNTIRVAIVGGGIAGMTASYRLTKAGIAHQLYEATNRMGGRVLTSVDAVVDGGHVDFGAEFVDSTHQELINLADELHVELIDLREDRLTSKAFFFEGKHRTEEELMKALEPFASRITDDIHSLPSGLHYQNGKAFKHLDDQSILDYLKAMGMTGWLLHFFDMAFTAEFAMEASEQSAINLLVMLATPFIYDAHYHLMGNHHEVMKFRGGSHSLTNALAQKVRNQTLQGYELKSLTKERSGYSLIFKTAEGEQLVEADLVVLAIPFTVLRDVERNFRFNDRKEQCISSIGFGNGSKVAMGFSSRPWRTQGYQGYTFTDVNDTVIWDSTQGVDIPEGSLTFVGGGKSSEEFLHLSYPEIESRWLTGAGKIFPGVVDEYNKRISKFCWESYPYAKGSYTSYRKGQWSAFAGVEAEPHEGILFAGEHCSITHQGFMNGAAETGRLAAEAVTKLVSLKS